MTVVQPALAPPRIVATDAPDGSLILRSEMELEPYEASLGLLLRHWAREAPDRVFLAERGPNGDWIELTWGEAGRKAVDFIHLHGTATPLNDQMEAHVVERVFGLDTPAASTKALTGHTLGAAGAIQAALCLLAMERGQLPPHVWDGERDPELPVIRLAQPGESAALKTILSASYAFGGNNVALVLTAA